MISMTSVINLYDMCVICVPVLESRPQAFPLRDHSTFDSLKIASQWSNDCAPGDEASLAHQG